MKKQMTQLMLFLVALTAVDANVLVHATEIRGC